MPNPATEGGSPHSLTGQTQNLVAPSVSKDRALYEENWLDTARWEDFQDGLSGVTQLGTPWRLAHLCWMYASIGWVRRYIAAEYYDASFSVIMAVSQGLAARTLYLERAKVIVYFCIRECRVPKDVGTIEAVTVKPLRHLDRGCLRSQLAA